MAQKRIPAIIPYFRHRKKLERCVAHLEAQTFQPIEVFIRDNTNDNILYTAASNVGLYKYAFEPDIDYV